MSRGRNRMGQRTNRFLIPMRGNELHHVKHASGGFPIPNPHEG